MRALLYKCKFHAIKPMNRPTAKSKQREGTAMAARLMPGLERRLKAEVRGDVLFDRFSRGRYATDASHYQMMPVGVVVPRTVEDAERAIALASAEGASVLPRGGERRSAARR